MMRYVSLKRGVAAAAAAVAAASVTMAFAAGGATADDAKSRGEEVELKPDLGATSFSAQNGFFFASMSKLAYQDKSTVSSSLQNMKHFKGLGDEFHWFESVTPADDPSFLEKAQEFFNIYDTQGFVAANDDAVIVVFRGTNKGFKDWITNLRATPWPVPAEWKWNIETEGQILSTHRGFERALGTIWGPMNEKIKELCGERCEKRKLYIAGHSLGGALATVATARLIYEDKMNVAGLYTIGSPRVFDNDLANIFDKTDNYGTLMKDKVFRARNNNDVVTRVPTWPFQHIGTEVYFDRLKQISTTSFADRMLGRLNSLVNLRFADGVTDHESEEYMSNFEAAVRAEKIPKIEKTKNIVTDAVNMVLPASGKKAEPQSPESKASKEEL